MLVGDISVTRFLSQLNDWALSSRRRLNAGGNDGDRRETLGTHFRTL